MSPRTHILLLCRQTLQGAWQVEELCEHCVIGVLICQHMEMVLDECMTNSA